MAHDYPPFSGPRAKRFAYEVAFSWLAEQSHNLTKKREQVGRDWVGRKIEFSQDARYIHKVNSSWYHEETWFVPLRKNVRGRTLKKILKAGVENTLTAADTLASPIPPGFYNPADRPEMDELHKGTNISKHLTGDEMGWTDLLAHLIGSMDADTREGGKLLRKGLKKELAVERLRWLAVRQRSLTKDGRVFRYAKVDVGPASLSTMENYVSNQNTPFLNLGEALRMANGGQKVLWATRAIIPYKRLNTDPGIPSTDVLIEDSNYDVKTDPFRDDDGRYHDT